MGEVVGYATKRKEKILGEMSVTPRRRERGKGSGAQLLVGSVLGQWCRTRCVPKSRGKQRVLGGVDVK